MALIVKPYLLILDLNITLDLLQRPLMLNGPLQVLQNLALHTMIQIDKEASEEHEIVLALVDEELSHLVPKLGHVILHVLVNVPSNHIVFVSFKLN